MTKVAGKLMKGDCRYVLIPNHYNGTTFVPAEFCGRPAGYRMKKDDSGRRVREYNTFCPECEKLIEQDARSIEQETQS